MTFETEQWLSPMLNALLATQAGGQVFARLMESFMAVVRADEAAATAVMEDFDRIPGIRLRGIDWIRLGQMIRHELGWRDYPAFPFDMMN
jgi:hypothetical protein